ncbi:ferritin [Guggenheimella bovis]
MHKDLLKKINEQIAMEIHSANFYLNMSAFLQDEGLDGMAHWLYIQHIEELDHAMKLYHYIIQRGEKAEILAIEKPVRKFENVLDVWKKGLEHEKLITKSFHEMMDIAMENKEYQALTLIQWYLDEQIEEEDNFSGIIDKLEYTESAKPAVMQLNAALSTRAYKPLPGGLLPMQGA